METPTGITTQTTVDSAALEAHRLVYGDRRADYGHPIFDYTRTADLATALLRHKLQPGVRLEPEDLARVMVAVKLSRESFRPKRDNRVDGAGYFEVLHCIMKWYDEHPGEDPRNHFGGTDEASADRSEEGSG